MSCLSQSTQLAEFHNGIEGHIFLNTSMNKQTETFLCGKEFYITHFDR